MNNFSSAVRRTSTHLLRLVLLGGVTTLSITAGCNKANDVAASTPSGGGAISPATGVAPGGTGQGTAASAGGQTDTPAPDASPAMVEKVKMTEPVRGIYLSGWTAGGTKRWGQLLDVIDKTEINAMVIDVKEDGMMSYKTDIPLAIEVGANHKMISDIDGKMAELRKRKVYSIARITCFRDEITAKKRLDLSVQTAGGKHWRDRSGHYWLDPYNKANWDYNVDVAIDAAKRGFNEVQWDYVRFPSEGSKANRVYPAKEKGDLRSEARVIAEFLKYAKEKLEPYDVAVSADIFGLTVSAKPDDDMGIGQKMDLMTPHLDLICPMVYPSHYNRGEYGIAYPNASPYKTVSVALKYAVDRLKGGDCKIRPWLQDFSLGYRYGAPEVRAQIKAAREHGIEEYLLWNASNRYTTAALVPLKPAKKKTERVTAKPSPSTEEADKPGDTETTGSKPAEKGVARATPESSPTP
ncbi:MAG: putative glycoside hydrolase [Akkermansiaceae bacterium]|nr:putative glycoside hydrolase [Armatimonadota bacterium]